jgi:polysaccharide export outer membrane protein
MRAASRTPERAVVLLALLLGACAPSRTPQPDAGLTPTGEAADAERVAALFASRSALAARDYCLGPGDLVSVNVFGWDRMRDLRVRVSSTGAVSLPLLGDVPAAGRTEGQLQAEIERRLRNGYMHDPHVSVFVQRFQSQQVSVTGAVARPGLYSLTRENRTLYDLVSQAGGQTEQAGGRILFSPARESPCGNGGGRTPAPGREAASLAPVEFELDAPVPPGGQHPLMLPVVGGDAIVVTRGRFMVDGWVARPGLYGFTPGMTAYGAISVAGGALYPANLRRAQIVRARRDGSKEVLEVDLAKVGRGEGRDVALREGDVIRFGASPIKMVPYSVYWIFSNLFRVGAGFSVAGV